MDMFGEVQQLIAVNLDVPAERVNEESGITDFPEWDSLHHLILVMALEERFECKLSLEEIAGLDSVKKIVEAIQKRVTE